MKKLQYQKTGKLILSWLYKHLERRNKMFKINTKKNITQNFWEIFYNIKNLPTVLFTKKGYAISKILNNKNIDDLIIFTLIIKNYTNSIKLEVI